MRNFQKLLFSALLFASVLLLNNQITAQNIYELSGPSIDVASNEIAIKLLVVEQQQVLVRLIDDTGSVAMELYDAELNAGEERRWGVREDIMGDKTFYFIIEGKDFIEFRPVRMNM